MSQNVQALAPSPAEASIKNGLRVEYREVILKNRLVVVAKAHLVIGFYPV